MSSYLTAAVQIRAVATSACVEEWRGVRAGTSKWLTGVGAARVGPRPLGRQLTGWG
jgi:hypothetical protein